MCIVIDTNTLASVFEIDSLNHLNFQPVYDWVRQGRGKVVYGGSKYAGELKGKYLKLFIELRNTNRAVHIDDHAVDMEEVWVSQQIQHNDFDDQHLVALLRVSGCRLICSLDERAYSYIRHDLFFKPVANKPKIYNQYRGRTLLVPANIAPVCKNNN